MQCLKFLSIAALLTLCFAPYVLAQNDCPALVTTALDAARTACQIIGRNQVCYGHVDMQVTPQGDAPQFTFQQAGDTTDIDNIQTLHLSAMDVLSSAWGIALMQLQANLPDTLPGQNVTIVLFGNVEFAMVSAQAVRLPVTATANVNVRLRPRTDENNVISVLSSGQQITADGRLDDGSWVRILLEDETVGWVAADFLNSDGDLSRLPVISAADGTIGPTQAFYFRGAVGDSQCAQAPESGMLIQTPRGVGQVTLQINGVQVALGSTAYVQTDGNAMRVALLAGQGVLFANDAEANVPTGEFTDISLDSAGQTPISSPTTSSAYDLAHVDTLPVQLLPDPVPSPGRFRPYLLDSACTGLQDGGPPIQTGETVRFAVGCCHGDTLEQQQQMEQEVGPPWMTLDGASLDLFVTGIFFAPVGWYTDDGRYFWVATPGSHTISGAWGTIPASTCAFEVQD
ncbi:MAG: SH3 domain-containing protein [Anaerolineae bacterium]